MAENDLSKNRCDVNRVYIRITKEEVYSRLPEHQEPRRLEAHIEEVAAPAGKNARKASGKVKAAALATGAAAAGAAAATIHKDRRQQRRKAPKTARHNTDAAAVAPETASGGGSGFIKWAALVVAGLVLASLAALFFTDLSRFRDHEHDRAIAAASTDGLYLVGRDNGASGREIAQAGWEGVAVIGDDNAGTAANTGQSDVTDLKQVNVAANAIAASGKTPVVVYLFGFDSDNVSESPELNALANAALASGKDISVKAYTDPSGNIAYNQELSEERAEAISDYLVAHGVPADHIVISALGPTHAFTSDALDHRAEVSII